MIEELDDYGQDPVEDPSSRPDQESQGRQKSVAALKPFDPYAVLARLSGPITTTNSAFISDLRSHYDVPEGQQAPGLVSEEYRIRLDGQDDPVDLECAYVAFCYEIKLDPSGTQ